MASDDPRQDEIDTLKAEIEALGDEVELYRQALNLIANEGPFPAQVGRTSYFQMVSPGQIARQALGIGPEASGLIAEALTLRGVRILNGPKKADSEAAPG